jgi:hypothetical protein
MSAQVTDNVDLRFVRFQVNHPSGAMLELNAEEGLPDVFSAQMTFFDDGAYTSRVWARDSNGNDAFTEWISFDVQNVETSPTTVAELLEAAKVRIEQTIIENPRIAATYVRLGFHDCVPGTFGETGSGCDGCINMATSANIGLLPAIEALAPIVSELLDSTSLDVSRADLWAYAAMVAAETSQNNLPFTDGFKTGRKTCEMAGTCTNLDCATQGPDQPNDHPDNDLTTHQLLDFMLERFGFNPDQTVAIMGAHTIGRALRQNSGFDGDDGWVRDEFDLGKCR